MNAIGITTFFWRQITGLFTHRLRVYPGADTALNCIARPISRAVSVFHLRGQVVAGRQRGSRERCNGSGFEASASQIADHTFCCPSVTVVGVEVAARSVDSTFHRSCRIARIRVHLDAFCDVFNCFAASVAHLWLFRCQHIAQAANVRYVGTRAFEIKQAVLNGIARVLFDPCRSWLGWRYRGHSCCWRIIRPIAGDVLVKRFEDGSRRFR